MGNKTKVVNIGDLIEAWRIVPLLLKDAPPKANTPNISPAHRYFNAIN